MRNNLAEIFYTPESALVFACVFSRFGKTFSCDLFPKGIVLALLLEALENEETNLNGYFIDGYPRTAEQLDEFRQKVTMQWCIFAQSSPL